jgi:hypothetical protein
MIALVILCKNEMVSGKQSRTSYQVSALATPASHGVHVEQARDNPKKENIRDGMADWQGTIRKFQSIGFTEEVFIPEGANTSNWDFELGVSMEDSKKIQDSVRKSFQEAERNIPKLDLSDYDDLTANSSGNWLERSGQMNSSISQYYQGTLPDPDQLDSYVGSTGVEASQIRSIFGGVDESISLVNQFDSSLLRDVAFIYNFSGAGAYGVYMSALDEAIKNSKIKSMLEMDGYQIQDMPNGSFYATHNQKNQDKIEKQIKDYQTKAGQSGATTFGINMNKVIGAAKADAADAGITDQNDQRLLGILHLGATMVHEAIHSKGAQSEGPSEQGEAKFMSWAMPIINEQRRKSYESQNRLQEYTPLIIDGENRRAASASNWMERAEGEGVVKTAQYGAQFLHNQTFVSHFGPAPWSSAFWNHGTGPIESMLDQARPSPQQASNLSFEAHLRNQNKDKWISSVDTGAIMEELLEPNREPLVAYKSTEKLIEDIREKPLMLSVPTKKSIKRKASYDQGKEAFGYMSNLDIPMEDRIQKWDNNDEESTWFDRKFIANQPRYQPEYGNPMSKEDGIYMWWVEPNGGPTLLDDPSEEHRGLKTSPWPKIASENKSQKMLLGWMETALNDIRSGKIQGTRLICPVKYVSFIEKFFDNEKAVAFYTFSDETKSNVWVVDQNVSQDSVELAESYVSGDTEDDNARQVFDEITSIPAIRDEAISKMIENISSASRQSGKVMYILGDFPLAVQAKQPWGNIRTMDFCAEDPDACIKIGEILCEKLGVICDPINEDSPIISHWKCMTFRFMRKSLTDEVNSRLLTPLMLAFDVVNEKIVDVSGEALPDVEAKVVRTVLPPKEAVALNPLIIVDAIFLASRFEFSIDSELADESVNAEFSDGNAKFVWAAIRASGKGKSMAVAEEYGIKDDLLRLMGEKQCQCQ